MKRTPEEEERRRMWYGGDYPMDMPMGEEEEGETE